MNDEQVRKKETNDVEEAKPKEIAPVLPAASSAAAGDTTAVEERELRRRKAPWSDSDSVDEVEDEESESIELPDVHLTDQSNPAWKRRTIRRNIKAMHKQKEKLRLLQEEKRKELERVKNEV